MRLFSDLAAVNNHNVAGYKSRSGLCKEYGDDFHVVHFSDAAQRNFMKNSVSCLSKFRLIDRGHHIRMEESRRGRVNSDVKRSKPVFGKSE